MTKALPTLLLAILSSHLWADRYLDPATDVTYTEALIVDPQDIDLTDPSNPTYSADDAKMVVRRITTTARQGQTSWIPLGEFSYRTVHSLKLSIDRGVHGNATASLEFSRTWGAQFRPTVFEYHKAVDTAYVDFYYYPAGNLHYGIAIRYGNTWRWAQNHPMTITHTVDRLNYWREPTATPWASFQANTNKEPFKLLQPGKGTGNGTVSLGSRNIASDPYSVAMGSSNTASGRASSAIGESNTASGDYSISYGRANEVTASGASAIGSFHDVYGTNSFSSGYENTLHASNSLSFGTRNQTGLASGTSYRNLNDHSQILNASEELAQGAIGMGWENRAYGNFSTAIGRHNYTLNTFSIALGTRNLSHGYGSVSIGADNNYIDSEFSGGLTTFDRTKFGTAEYEGKTFSGSYSTAIGSKNSTAGYAAAAIGEKNKASGGRSAAIGSSNISAGEYSVALGFENKTIKRGATAIGWRNEANGFYSSAFGVHNKTNGRGQFIIGEYNDPVGNPNERYDKPEDYMFIVGSGNGETSRRNALTIQRNGKSHFTGDVEVDGSVKMNNTLILNAPAGDISMGEFR